MKLVTCSVGSGTPEVGMLEGEEIRPLGHESIVDSIGYGGAPSRKRTS